MKPSKQEVGSNPESRQELIDRLNLEVAEFFETEPLEPNVVVYDSKEEFDIDWKNGEDKEIPDWVVAFADYSGRTHILSPNIMPKGNEPTGKQRFEKTLKHETAHHYVRQINKNVSKWLNEGVCLYVADQNYFSKGDPKTITVNLLNQLVNTTTDERIYWVGKNMVDMIMQNFGKEKLFELVAIHSKDDRYTELQKMFVWLK